jgi:hypothetical protein
MLARGWLEAAEDGYALTAAGARGLGELGLDGDAWLARARAARANEGAARRFAYPCLDWSERRDHLAGKLASALLAHFVERGWLRREPGERALALTPPGQLALGPLLEPST